VRDTLRRCKKRAVAVDDEEKHQRVAVRRRSWSSLPTRLAQATKSLVSSILSGRNRSDDDGYGWSGDAVRRFEWFADGASDFLRFVELGGTPRRYMFFDPLIGHLLAGKELRYRTTGSSAEASTMSCACAP
jgi:hypothetical protein